MTKSTTTLQESLDRSLWSTLLGGRGRESVKEELLEDGHTWSHDPATQAGGEDGRGAFPAPRGVERGGGGPMGGEGGVVVF